MPETIWVLFDEVSIGDTVIMHGPNSVHYLEVVERLPGDILVLEHETTGKQVPVISEGWWHRLEVAV